MNQFANAVIDRLGGTNAVAELCECRPPSVSQWRTEGIPKYRLQFLRLARPDVFEGLEEHPAPEKASAA
ncbi:hypothetical protein PQQ84_22565 [Paraburkholderia strydomiana]|jgi:hypothetical protein|uniref:hypothetical protein n=1 Tax=Paraburkholderia strydomiana TaxID=1245417 RepID=UPI0038BD95E9